MNFPRGIQIERSGAVHRCIVLSSPFLSLIAASRGDAAPATVYVAKHARARDRGPLREVQAPPVRDRVVVLAEWSAGSSVRPDAHEVGLTEAIDRGGLTRDVGRDHAELGVPEPVDLTLDGWRELLDAGFPFVKPVLTTGPHFAQRRWPAVERAIADRRHD